LVKAGENGDRKQLQPRVATTFHRRLHHRFAAVDSQESDAAFGYLRHRSFDGLSDVIKLHVQEDLRARPGQLAHQFHTSRGVQFHPDLLLEVDGVAKCVY
jgi:hypothetical protein